MEHLNMSLDQQVAYLVINQKLLLQALFIGHYDWLPNHRTVRKC